MSIKDWFSERVEGKFCDVRSSPLLVSLFFIIITDAQIEGYANNNYTRTHSLQLQAFILLIGYVLYVQ